MKKISSLKMRGICFAAFLVLAHTAFAATFSPITPSAISNLYGGDLTLQFGGLTNGETVLIEKFLDANANGIIDAPDSLVQSFKVTDGQASRIGGVTNLSVPFDSNSTAGAITTRLKLRVGTPELIIGKYAFKLSSPTSRFAPITNIFNVTNSTFAQQLTGTVRSGGTAVPNAIVILLAGESDDDHDFVGGAVANASGVYTIKAPPGTYLLAAFKSNYVANFSVEPTVLGSGQTKTADVNTIATTRIISGKAVDAGNTNTTLPGVLIIAESTNNLVALAYSDREGRFTIPVTASEWQFHAETDSLPSLGYIGVDEGVMANTVAGNVSGKILGLIKATALIYGTVKDAENQPLAGVRISLEIQNGDYDVSGIMTAQDGNYAAGVVAGEWMPHVSSHQSGAAVNYVFSENMMSANLTAGQTAERDFIALLATNRITGYVRNNGNPVSEVDVYAYATINDVEYQVSGSTDEEGNYSLNVANGVWSVGVNCNGGDSSLSEYGLQCVNNQSVTVANNNKVVNFTPQSFSTRLRGRVVSDLGAGVPDMRVYAFPYYGGQNFQATTDNNGNFDLGIVGGTYSVQLNTDSDSGAPSRGLVSPSLQVNISEGINVDNFIVVAPRITGQVNGLVKDNLNNPVANLDVYAYATINGTNYNIQARTDESGHFSMGAANGTWSVSPSCYDSGGLPAHGYQCIESYAVTILNNNGTANFTVQPCTLQIETTTLDNATSGVSYNGYLQGSGCNQPFTWSISPGSALLPSGLYFETYGGSYAYISGTPNVSGTFNFSVRLTDNAGAFVDKPFTLIISPGSVQLNTTSLPGGTRNTFYSAQLSASGGQTPYTWSIYYGSLPSGLSLNSKTGVISGTPTTTGTFSFTVGVVDFGNQTSERYLSLSIQSEFAPANDNFANRITAAGLTATVNGSNVDAGQESDEPNPSYDASQQSVWWTWTAPITGMVTMDTVGSSFDTLLAVYTGDSLSSLYNVESNDNAPGGVVQTSWLTFSAVAGTAYQIRVDGIYWSAPTGNIVLNIRETPPPPPPANDLFSNRISVTGLTNSVTGTNAYATKEAGEANHAGYSGGKSVWWSWTAPATGTATIDTIGSSFDTLLGVYTGNAVSSLVPIASDDDSGGNATSLVSFSALAGTVYQIAVDGWSAGGTIILNIRETSAPVSAISLSGNLEFGSVTVGASAQRTLTISNTGNAPLTVSGINYPTGFSGSFSGTIAGGASTNVTVTFSPTSVTSFGGNLTVNSDKNSGTNTKAISGTGAAAPTRIISLSGDLAFGNVTVGSSAQRTLTINNTGNSTLNVSAINYPTGFSGSFSGAIGAGASSSVTVTFSPASATAFSGNLTVSSDATSGTGTKAVSGTGTPAVTAPEITVQPQPQAMTNGGNATIYVVATGTAPLRYQWRKTGTNILNATNAAYNIANVQTAHAGNYSVTVSNSVGGVVSSNALLTILIKPTITVQPVSKVINAGGTVTFSITATGTAPLSYFWHRNDSLISSGTNNTYTITNAQPDVAGTYKVRVSNSAGSVISSNAVLTVNTAPTITSQPENRTVASGGTATFAVTATGTAPLKYQWRKNGTNVLNATNASFSIVNVQTTHAANYSALVSNSVGNMVSSNAALTVLIRPSITVQPVSKTVAIGSPVTFSVTAAGSAPLSYQWRNNEVPISNETNASFTLSETQPANAGRYSVTVSNSVGGIISSNALLTVSTPVVITVQPESKTVTAGPPPLASVLSVIPTQFVIFSVTATGTAPLKYQWRKNEVNLLNATNSTFKINDPQPSHSGNYSVVVNNSFSSATSSNAVLTVLVKPAITTQPVSKTVIVGNTATFSVVATGTAPLSYQWQKGEENIFDATNSSYSITNVQTSAAGSYKVRVSNSATNVLSSAAILTVIVPPVIVMQPENKTVIGGSNVAFAVTATGTAPLKYQWRKTGTNILNATNASYNIVNAQSSHAGIYSVLVSNSAGSQISSNAVLTVLIKPAITTQPVSKTVIVGNTATFSVVATGTAPLSYQWQKGEEPIFGATNTNYSITNVQTSAAGTYKVRVSNAATNVLSSAAILTVIVPPAITMQPESKTVIGGSNVTFAVTATGTAPLKYQWRKTGTNILNATNASYNIVNAQTVHAGIYSVLVSNSAGSTTSSNAVLTVLIKPAITTQPVSKTVIVGNVATFSVVATGTAPLSYQWQKGEETIFDATNATYNITNVQTSAAGTYKVRVSNAAASILSSNAVLTVIVPPAITMQPENKTVIGGSNVTFAVAATGTAPLKYQWRKTGTNILNATNASYNIVNAQVSHAGIYSVLVNNSAGSTTSSNAVLTVLIKPAITTQPVSKTVIVGNIATFSVTATGTAPLNYQWQKGEENIFDATNATYNITNVQTSAAGTYKVRVSNAAASVLSSNAVLTVIVPPAITMQPEDKTVIGGSNVTFAVTATGTAPLKYQWRKTGTNILNATNASYSIVNAQTVHAGIYSVLVSNSAGSTTSSNAVLTVLIKPAITTQPVSKTVIVGNVATFSVVATGTAPLNYQWQKGEETIFDATNSSYSITNVQTSAAGTYKVRVSNAAASVLSSNAVLTVRVPVSITSQPQGQALLVGTNVTFSVTAVGTAPIKYQWRKNTVNILNATNATYSLSNLVTTHSGTFSVVVSNIVNSVTSSNATLLVTTPPPRFTLTTTMFPTNAGTILIDPPQPLNGYLSNTVVTLTANGEGTFYGWSGSANGISNSIAVTMNANKSAKAHFDDTGLIWQHTDGRLEMWFMDRTNFLGVTSLNGVSNTWSLIAAHDFNADAEKDLLLQAITGGDLALWFMNGSRVSESVLMGQPAAGWKAVAVGDFNSDGKGDLLLQTTSQLAVWYLNGSTFVSSQSIGTEVSTGWKAVAVGDFASNGAVDIVLQHTNGQVAMWLMNGTTRDSTVSVRNGTSAGSLKLSGLGDFNADGKLDLLFASTNGQTSAWFLNGTNYVGTATLNNGRLQSVGWKIGAVKSGLGNQAIRDPLKE